VLLVVAVVCVIAASASARSLRQQRHHRPRSVAPAPYIPTKGTAWPRPKVLEAATRAFKCGRDAGYFRDSIITIIDYSLPSTTPRLWVVDLARKKVLFNELVAHGLNSGEDLAVAFSNRPGSKMSSLGLFRTAETYWGKHGFALRLDGLEPGFNESARERAIVLHGADYVDPGSITKLGHLGRSWGCPAVSRRVSGSLINRIQGGTALFAYYPDARWLKRSDFLQCGVGSVARAAR
jgi:hypothetical protein